MRIEPESKKLRCRQKVQLSDGTICVIIAANDKLNQVCVAPDGIPFWLHPNELTKIHKPRKNAKPTD